MCKGLRPLKVNCPKGKRSWPGPCAFNQSVFSNFFKSLKIRPAWRKDFFATLGRPVWPPLPRFRFAPWVRWVRSAGVHPTQRLRPRLRSSRRGRCPHRPASLCVQGSPPAAAGVGRHAPVPPWPDFVTCKPGGSGGAVRAAASRPYEVERWRVAMAAGLIWRGVGTPPYGPDRKRGVGAASSRPSRPPISIVLPPNAVGRHAPVPPWQGSVTCKPGSSGECGPGGC